MIAWLATARADEVLDRSIRFQISSSPLASALIEFSTQSGIQVAAADADVAHLNSKSVNGTLPIRAALSTLLRGTGLEFSRIGAQTVVIRRASTATRAVNSGAAVEIPTAKSARPDPDANASASPEIPEVTVTAPRPPTDAELAGDSVYQFIVHHATNHYVDTGTSRNLARWRGGRQSICPKTVGLDPEYNAFVTARLRALAAYVGAPLQSDPQCKDNVRIVFRAKPEEYMNNVVKWAKVYFRRGSEFAQMKPLIAFTGDHAIQGWYLTTGGGPAALNTDVMLLRLDLLPIWPRITPHYADQDSFGGGGGSGIGVVILLVDTTKVVGYTMGTIADYLAMLTLSMVQSPDYCDPLPSILDTFSLSCGARERPTAITAGDLAFLKALYYLNTGLGPGLSRDDIENDMMRQFRRR
jgi:Secretin and TonB N terminus short domain